MVYIVSFLVLIVPVNNVVAVPVNWLELTDFDEFNLGDINGTSGNFMMNCTIYNDWQVGGDVSDKYLDLKYSTGIDAGYFNDTATGHYGYYFRFHFWRPKISFSFYNQSGFEVIKLRFIESAGSTRLEYQDYNNVWTLIYNYGGIGQAYGFVYWNYYTENVIQYRLYDNNLNILDTQNGTGKIAGVDFVNKSQFNCSSMYIYYDAGYYTGNWFYLKEYGYVDEDIYGEETFPELSGVFVETYYNGEWISGLPDICIGATVRYRLTAYPEDARMCVNMTNQTNDYVMGFCTLEQMVMFDMQFMDFDNITLNIYDPLHLESGYAMADSFEIVYCGMPNWDDFGDFYAQFYTTGESCYYVTGSNPEIMINFQNLTGYPSYIGRYYVDIYETWALDEELVHTMIVYDDTIYYRHLVTSVHMVSQYTYELRVYNTTLSNGVLVRDDLIYTSNPVNPCADSDGDGIPDVSDDDPFVPDDDEESEEDGGTGSFTDDNLNVILGVCIAVGLGVGLLIVTHSTGAMFLGIGIGAFMLSNESLGTYQLLPITVGVGIISLLFVVGFFIWVTD